MLQHGHEASLSIMKHVMKCHNMSYSVLKHHNDDDAWWFYILLQTELCLNMWDLNSVIFIQEDRLFGLSVGKWSFWNIFFAFYIILIKSEGSTQHIDLEGMTLSSVDVHVLANQLKSMFKVCTGLDGHCYTCVICILHISKQYVGC